MKRFVCLLLAVLLLLSVVPNSVEAKKKKKPKLSEKNIEMQLDDYYTLKVLNTSDKIKWSISNDKAIEITSCDKKNQEIIIHSKRPSTLRIVAKGKKFTLFCNITIIEPENYYPYSDEYEHLLH